MTSVPAPSTLAPILLSKRASSSISGSRAALTKVVRPFARTAALIKFSVPVTVGMSRTISAPCRRPLGTSTWT